MKRLTSLLTLVLLATTACGDDDTTGGNSNNDGNNNNAGLQCGNGVVEGLEECDDGPANSDTQPDACRTDCLEARCGDGVEDSEEACDDGLANSDVVPDACRQGCTLPTCGDGVVDITFGELCDDNNTDDGDLCSSHCVPVFCGNGVMDEGEQCDDGNVAPGDGCGPTCLQEVCGNAFIDPGEACDDGNTEAGDGCRADCTVEICGNGELDPMDLGAGIWEVCDDGNTLSGDGCSADCLSEEVCGNGYVDGLVGEVCDDGNRRSHDGCSSGCGGEYANWQPVPTSGESGGLAAMAFDVDRGRLVAYGPGAAGVTWEYNGDDWEPVFSLSNPGARVFHAMAYDEVRGRVVLYGGSLSSSNTTTWEYDGREWIPVITSTHPPSRFATAMAWHPGRQTVVLFGGTSVPVSLNDMWEYDGTDWVELSPGTAPPPRAGHAMVYDQSLGGLLLFGGCLAVDPVSSSCAGPLEDTWFYNGTSWSLLMPLSHPSGRLFHAMTYDVARGRSILFGGTDASASNPTTHDDTWEFAGGNWVLRTPSTPPLARSSHALGYDPVLDRTLLLGGCSEYNMGTCTIPVLQTAQFNGTQWTDTSRPPPSPRAHSVAAFDEARGELVVFGGYSDQLGALVGDTWLFDGRRWSEVSGGGPSARNKAAIAYDSARRRIVLFGGCTAVTVGGSDCTQVVNDTWEFDGNAWSLVNAGPAPSPRHSSGLTYDSARGAVVLFGGMDAAETGSGETWEYDGSSWIQAAPVAAPPASAQMGMTYDASRQVTVVFGAGGVWGGHETWEYDGTTWTEVVSAFEPAGRIGARLAFSPMRGKVVLFGGCGNLDITSGVCQNALGDSWELDGSGWSLIGTLVSPTARWGHAMAYLEALRGVMVFSGVSDNAIGIPQSYRDVWSYRMDSLWPEERCHNGDDDDQDGLIDCADPDCAQQSCGPYGAGCVSGYCP